jgi:PIN domain nuclease of toxin-antitoxin system
LKLLLDTHALLWWGEANPRLSSEARRQIDSPANSVFVSSVSAMEVATKFRLGKLPSAAPLARDFEGEILGVDFQPLSLTIRHAQMAGSFPFPHKDPFDRLLVAQAILEGMTLVSNEAVFDSFGVTRLW